MFRPHHGLQPKSRPRHGPWWPERSGSISQGKLSTQWLSALPSGHESGRQEKTPATKKPEHLAREGARPPHTQGGLNVLGGLTRAKSSQQAHGGLCTEHQRVFNPTRDETRANRL